MVSSDLCSRPLSPSTRYFLREGVCTQAMLIVFFFTIGHFSNEGGTGAEMRPAFASGIVNGTRQSAIGHFFPVLSNSPRSVCQSYLGLVPPSILFLFEFFFSFYFYSSPCTIRWRANRYKGLKVKCCYPVMACRTKKWPYKV